MSSVPPGTSREPLETSPQFLKGVGPKLAQLLAKVGIHTVRDLLFHLPHRYEDRRNLPPMASLKPGQYATVRGKVVSAVTRTLRGNRVLFKVIVTDRTGDITLTWFNQPWVKNKLTNYRGELIAYGLVKEAGYELEIASPEYELLDEGEENENFTRIVPVYPLSEGLPQWVVRRAAQAAVEKYLEFVPETLSDAILKEHGLKRIHWALRQIHMPDSEEDQKAARKRLVFDEFFRLQLALAVRRGQVHAEVGIAFPLDEHPEVIQDLKKLIPFELTGAQDRVIHEILRDMREPHPMNRLVQGDVGAGKTLVAAAAMLACVRCGYQAVLMAPTEILAEQHTANLRRLFEPLLIPVVSLVGRMTKTEKAKSRAKLESGQPMIAVGTHALIQDEVRLPKLGLAVIDEQHRFGVMQRASLRGKGFGNPDVLVMTATPIPRTLAMALYGDLDISVIDELPPNRKPIKTHFKPPDQRESTYESAGQLLRQGAQAYVVCPLVGESEKMLAQAATELHDQLTGGQYHDLRVGLLHGQLKSKEKDAVMEAFRAHQLDVLVATTVIEVGVDVPNATIMIIEDAHRFGLSQLHQLRGRIGRGGKQSYCVLIGDARTDEAKARMDIMVATSDGFRIADEDLKIRGPGDMLGTRQSGALGLHVADLIKDARMLEVARTAAQDLLRQDPTLSRPEHRALKDVLRKQTADLASIALS